MQGIQDFAILRWCFRFPLDDWSLLTSWIPEDFDRLTPQSSAPWEHTPLNSTDFPIQMHIYIHLPSGKLAELWKITIFHGKTHSKWPFSIAMLVITRGGPLGFSSGVSSVGPIQGYTSSRVTTIGSCFSMKATCSNVPLIRCLGQQDDGWQVGNKFWWFLGGSPQFCSTNIIWLVVWNMIFFIFPYIGNNYPNWLTFFRGVQTSQLFFLCCFFLVSLSCLKKRWHSFFLKTCIYALADYHSYGKNTHHF